ncbi:MAG: YdcH family protein [Patescibacteria group bacterium]
MGIENHIKSLEAKHAAVDVQIRTLRVCPTNSAQISTLKKEKLRLKDEITRLNNPNRLTAPKPPSRKKAKGEKAPDAIESMEPDVETDQPQIRSIDIAA